ncbi:hypothetical protein GW915_13725 [bacterium]|nr:hypothetical protein [bacterium]
MSALFLLSLLVNYGSQGVLKAQTSGLRQAPSELYLERMKDKPQLETEEPAHLKIEAPIKEAEISTLEEMKDRYLRGNDQLRTQDLAPVTFQDAELSIHLFPSIGGKNEFFPDIEIHEGENCNDLNDVSFATLVKRDTNGKPYIASASIWKRDQDQFPLFGAMAPLALKKEISSFPFQFSSKHVHLVESKRSSVFKSQHEFNDASYLKPEFDNGFLTTLTKEVQSAFKAKGGSLDPGPERVEDLKAMLELRSSISMEAFLKMTPQELLQPYEDFMKKTTGSHPAAIEINTAERIAQLSAVKAKLDLLRKPLRLNPFMKKNAKEQQRQARLNEIALAESELAELEAQVSDTLNAPPSSSNLNIENGSSMSRKEMASLISLSKLRLKNSQMNQSTHPLPPEISSFYKENMAPLYEQLAAALERRNQSLYGDNVPTNCQLDIIKLKAKAGQKTK